ncbi:cysteine desulfurase [Aliidongia dinghuensis]|uniref:Cysteine desulfurase n=1 Tax=Aliidongia dinghuensis TaxID=1867774 RepID=A0A8J3E1W6_9PROT|nr:cysteine desulfurase family protein [Aliidongia dinghuensis]GGF03136.1 cysteine desulfurase [Aliidongia dinghuensis]
MATIYLDFNASTPLSPIVTEAMKPFLDAAFGNPSSEHWAGKPAKAALDRAREQVAGSLGCAPDEIVFTSGGTEANNLAIKGTYFAAGNARAHVVTSAIEHPAVLNPCRFIEKLGGQVTYLPVDAGGRVDPDQVRSAITPRTVLITIMHANNETGTIQPIEEIAAIARDHGVRFHTDAAQSVGKIGTAVDDLGVDLLTIAGHKLYAPKGVGALYMRRGTALEPLLSGAGHEHGRRAGTESVLLTTGLGAASELVRDLAPMARVARLRDRFWAGLEARFPGRVIRNGDPVHCLPNTLNVAFPGRVGAEILRQLDGVAASTGSACHAGRIELSPVLKAMGVPPEVGMGAIRFSLGRSTTAGEIDQVLEMLEQVLQA